MAIPVDCPPGTRDVDTTLREGSSRCRVFDSTQEETQREASGVQETTEDLRVSQISYLGKTDYIPLWEHHGYGDIT